MRVDTEKMENTYDPQHPEYDEPAQEEERQDRQKIDDTVVGKQEFQPCPPRLLLLIKIGRGPDAQDILDQKDPDRHIFQDVKHVHHGFGELKCREEHDQDIGKDDRDDEIVEYAAGRILPVADLDNIECSSFDPALLHLPVRFRLHQNVQ